MPSLYTLRYATLRQGGPGCLGGFTVVAKTDRDQTRQDIWQANRRSLTKFELNPLKISSQSRHYARDVASDAGRHGKGPLVKHLS